MKKQLVLFCCCLGSLVSCSVKPQQSKPSGDDVDLNYIMQSYDSVYTLLSGTIYSKDSIIIKTTFINATRSNFYLYKPLLPSDGLLKRSPFSIDSEDETAVNQLEIPFSGSVTNVYGKDTGQYWPQIFPPFIVNKEDLLLLLPSDSLSFTINLAKLYDFKPTMKLNKSFRNFSVAYGVITPFINDRFELVFQLDKQNNTQKPVFVIVGMRYTKELEKYASERLYFTVKDE